MPVALQDQKSEEPLAALAPAGRRPRLWAVGSGKGGVGKSVVTANLAVALAQKGKKCVILDADLGGANQHTLLGMASPRASLADLFSRTASSLAPRLIVNQVQMEEDLELGRRMATAYRHYFGVQADFLGAIRSDDRVRHAVRMKRPVLEAFPQSVFAQAIREIVEYRLHAGEAGNARP